MAALDPRLLDAAFVVGRLLFGGLLAFMALPHFTKLAMLAQYAAGRRVPFPKPAVLGAGVALLAGALSILLGVYPWIGVALLTIFFLPVTLMMHSFWKDTDPMQRMANLINLEKNLVILGAAWMFLLIPDPWPYAVLPG